MQFRTPVHPTGWAKKIDYSSRILMLGSCFAELMATKLSALRFHVCANPTGVLYNPLSIAQTLQWLRRNTPMTRQELQHDGQLYYSYRHHSHFSDSDPDRCLHKINAHLAQGVECLQRAGFLFVTLGSAHVYRLKETQQVVANCHRTPAAAFDCRMLPVAKAAEALKQMTAQCQQSYPQLQIVFSVSPIRYLKNGAHANQLSKATLLLAVDEVLREFPAATSYFPAYEIVHDELRDYRFYDPDMVHPSPVAASYVWEKFAQVAFDDEVRQHFGDIETLNAGYGHRPRFPQSAQHQQFLDKQAALLRQLQTQIPQANWEPSQYKI